MSNDVQEIRVLATQAGTTVSVKVDELINVNDHWKLISPDMEFLGRSD
jgi:hypothetical protein